MNRIAQIYGYSVCLVAVLVVVSYAGDFVDAAYAKADPIHSGSSWSRSERGNLVSFDAYRLDAEKDRESAVRSHPSEVIPPMLPDSVLQRRYEAERAAYIYDARISAERDLVKNGLVLLLSIVLFVTHWRWTRRIEREASSAPTA